MSGGFFARGLSSIAAAASYLADPITRQRAPRFWMTLPRPRRTFQRQDAEGTGHGILVHKSVKI